MNFFGIFVWIERLNRLKNTKIIEKLKFLEIFDEIFRKFKNWG